MSASIKTATERALSVIAMPTLYQNASLRPENFSQQQKQVARLEGVEKEIEQEEAKKPALRFLEGWTAYLQNQSRPRSGQGTLRNYEQQYFIFVEWLAKSHPSVVEMRHVTPKIAEEYAQFLLTGTPKDERLL